MRVEDFGPGPSERLTVGAGVRTTARQAAAGQAAQQSGQKEYGASQISQASSRWQNGPRAKLQLVRLRRANGADRADGRCHIRLTPSALVILSPVYRIPPTHVDLPKGSPPCSPTFSTTPVA